MLEQIKGEIDQLMSKYENDQVGLKAAREQQRAAMGAFNKEFERLKHEVIWPELVEIGNQLNTYGHDYHIQEDEAFTDATAHTTPATLTFNIYPKILGRAFYKPDCTPYIQFVANPYGRRIQIMVSTMMPERGGVIGAHGEYEPEKITKEFVEKEVLEVLKNSLIFHQE